LMTGYEAARVAGTHPSEGTYHSLFGVVKFLLESARKGMSRLVFLIFLKMCEFMERPSRIEIIPLRVDWNE
jgi:hypothetical protein